MVLLLSANHSTVYRSRDRLSTNHSTVYRSRDLLLLCSFLLLSPTVLSFKPCTTNCRFLLDTTPHSPNTTLLIQPYIRRASNITIVFNNNTTPGTRISFIMYKSNQTILGLELVNESTVEVWGTRGVVSRVNISVATSGRPDGRRYVEIEEVLESITHRLLYHLINGVKYTYNNGIALDTMALVEVKQAQNLYYVKSCLTLSQPRICSMTTDPPRPEYNKPFTITAIISGGRTGMQLSWTQQKWVGSTRYDIPSNDTANDTDPEYPIKSSIHISNFTEKYAGIYNCTILGQQPDPQGSITKTQEVDYVRVVKKVTHISKKSINVTTHEVRNKWGPSHIECQFTKKDLLKSDIPINKSTIQYDCISNTSGVFDNRVFDCGYDITTFTINNVELDSTGDGVTGVCTVYANRGRQEAAGKRVFRVQWLDPDSAIMTIMLIVGIVGGGCMLGGCYVACEHCKSRRGRKDDEVEFVRAENLKS